MNERSSIEFLRKKAEEGSYLTDTGLIGYEVELGLKFNLLRGKRVLDIGSGITEKMSKQAAKKGVEVVSVRTPSDKENIPIDSEFWDDWQRRSVFGQGQLLPFTDESFDYVVSLYALPFYLPRGGLPREPIADEYRIFFSEIIRVLKPGGQAYMAPALKNYHKTEKRRPVPRDFLEAILDDLSAQISYKLEDSFKGGESRLVITKKG